MNKIYLSNKELIRQVIISKAQGKRTRELDSMLILLGQRTIRKMTYETIEDRSDCLHSGILRLFIYWKQFDEEKYDNAFSFYTEIFKREIANEFNRLKRKDRNSGEYMTFVSLNNKDADGNYFEGKF